MAIRLSDGIAMQNKLFSPNKKKCLLSRAFRSLISRMFLILRNERETRLRIRLLGLVVKMFMKELFLPLDRKHLSGRETFLGFCMHFPSYSTFSFLFHCVFLRCDYEFKCANTSPVIVDCGSNIGMSILWFKWKYPGARIVAFEPDEQTFAYLCENVRINNLSGVELHQKAVGSKEEQRNFYFDTDNPASLGMSLSKRLYEGDAIRVGKTTVDCVALSRFLDGPVDILKLDVEGAEYEVLSELHAKGRLRDIAEIFVEYHYNECNPENSLSKILSLLESTGYRYIIDSRYRPPYYTHCGRGFKLNIYAYL